MVAKSDAAKQDPVIADFDEMIGIPRLYLGF